MPRFFQAPEWRHVITDLETTTLTFLDRLAIDGRVDYDLNTPSQLSFRVPSASPEVNILHDDDFPFVAEGVRLCYSFRRDGSGQGGSAPWGVRHAGHVLLIEDEGDPDTAMSQVTVFDPWQYLYARPCVDDDGCALPPGQGYTHLAQPAAEIALYYLTNAITCSNLPFHPGIDAGVIYAGTAFYNGYLTDDSQPIDYNVQRGKSVGELFEDMAALGLLDFEFVPIYDPDNRPGYVSELNIYAQPTDDDAPRGHPMPDAIFSWDKPPRTLSGMNRRLDGRERANVITFFDASGTEVDGSPLSDQNSMDLFGIYHATQQFPDMPVNEGAYHWAVGQLLLRARGRRDVIPIASPQQPPLIWDEFFVGDRVPCYASSRLRQVVPSLDPNDGDGAYHRVVGITLELDPEEQMTEVRVQPEAEIFIDS